MAKKMTRKKLREHLFLMLFRMDFYEGTDLSEQISLYLEELEEASEEEKQELRERFQAVLDHTQELDQRIGEKANGWSLKRLAKADLTVLRLAVYEILYDERIPEGVSINEAVELAKTYGGEKSTRFVNGVLASIAREQQEKKKIESE